MVFKFIVRQVNAGLLLAALVLTVWGTVDDKNTFTYIGGALSLIILEFLVERLSLNDKLLTYLDDSQRPGTPSMTDLMVNLQGAEEKLADLLRSSSADVEETRRNLNRLNQTLEQLQETVSRHLVSFFPLLNADEPSRGFHELRHMYALRGARLQSNGLGLEVDRNESIRLWRDALIESRSWDALSSADELWEDDERAISEGYQELQRRLGSHNRVRRVFVVNDIEELRSRQDLLHVQAETISRENLRWILRTDLTRILARRGIVGHQLTRDLDFAVIDDSFVLWFILDGDEERQLTGSRLLNDPETLNTARKVFDAAFNNGTELDS
jgi:hypothetical protein